jgi:hypothetical protein
VSKTWAVLTGDIVGSSKLDPKALKGVMQRLRDGAERFGEVYEGAVYGKLDVFSGDGWQMLIEDWRRAPRAALYLRAVVKSEEKLKTDTRVAIAWGPVNETTLMPESISESTGDAFTESGRWLRAMRKGYRLALNPGLSGDELRFLDCAVSLVDALVSRWTARQAEAVALALLARTQEEIAAQIGKSQPTVHQALQTAGWHGIEELLSEIEYRL